MTTERTEGKSHLIVLAGLILAAVAALSIVLFSPTRARAQSALQAYAGVHGGYSMMNTEVSSPLAPGFSIDGLGSKGFGGGIHGGVDVALPSSIFFVGVFADYTWQKVDFSINPIATARLGDAYTVGFRGGIAPGKSKFYGLIGYKHAESSINVAGVDMPSFHGMTYGAGTSYNVAPNVSVGGEVLYTHYQSASVMGVVNLQPDQLEVRAFVNFQLGNLTNPLALAPAPLK